MEKTAYTVDTAITNGRVVTEDTSIDADIGIRNGRIANIAASGTLAADAARVIDATGRLVLPGFIDSHVHVNLELGEYTTTDSMADLTRAAAHGGVTTVIPFAVPDEGKSPLDALTRRLDEAAGDAYVDYSFHGCLTGATESHLEQIPELIDRGAASIKAFLVYENRLMLDDGELRAVMGRTADAGGTMLVHAEDNAIINRSVERHRERGDMAYAVHDDTHPPVSETAAMWTVSELVAESDCPTLLVHASAKRTDAVIAHAEREHLPLAVETCPHYITLTDNVYDCDDGERFVCSPPVRASDHRDALRELVAASQIAVVNSDHCGYTTAQKRRHRDDITRMPNGLPGVETTAPLLFSEVADGTLSVQQFVRFMSTNVAKLFGLYPKKGTLAVGSDADIVVFNPDTEWTIDAETLHMATDYSPFDGRSVTGRAETVFVRGERVVDEELVGAPTVGEYCNRDSVSATERYRAL
jgi:dihydropyrimidinase